jgi:hypothetical protein
MTDPASYRPSSADLLRTVADFLAHISPKLDGGDRYSALVCSHILAMLQRELTTPPLPPLDEAALAAAIRRGDHDGDAACAETILRRTVARVRVVKPEHLGEAQKK